MKTPGRVGVSRSVTTVVCFAIKLLAPTTMFAQTCIAPPSGLISWWPGDGSIGDIQGGHNADLHNGATYGSGTVAQAFQLDGVDDFLSAPPASAFDVGSGDFTVDLWINFVSTGGEQVLLEKWVEGPNATGWTLTKRSWNAVQFAIGRGGDASSEPISFPTDTWIHFAARRADGALSVFMNGTLIASGSSTSDANSTSSIKFGHRGDPNDTPGSNDSRGFYLNGRIDEVQFFARALSDTEIQDIYNAGSDGQCAPTPSCGNGRLEAGEACDDGNAIVGDGCENDCTLSCGNGVVSAGEACDDGNRSDGDGCSTTCAVEPCYVCPGSPSSCSANDGAACDDGLFCNGTETCSGTTCVHAGDPCAGGTECNASCNEVSDNCFDSSAEPCTTDADPCTADLCDGAGNCAHPAAQQCGDGYLCGTEQCDDGNANNGDGCSATCAVEPCYVCSGSPSSCSANDGAACDDGLFCTGSETCSGTTCVHAGDPCASGTECNRTCNETSDDCFDPSSQPCTADADACTADLCDGSGTCAHLALPLQCGDAHRCGSEACDDGNLNSGDGCDSNCTVTACGNGVSTAGEECDDGNQVDSDACHSDCTLNCLLPAPSLIGWWRGEGNGNDLRAGHSATLQNGASYATGKVGQAFRLDGSDDFVSIADDPAFDIGSGDFTIAFWVNLDTTSGAQVLVEKWVQSAVPTGWTFLKTADNRLQFSIAGGNSATTPPGPDTSGQWLHLAAGRHNGVIRIFVNGSSYASANNSSNADSTASLKLGHRGNATDTPGSLDNTGQYLRGRIDEVELYIGQALSPAQISAIYAAGSGGQCTSRFCGNGTVSSGEVCDDANTANGDGCDNNCTVTACDNGIVTSGEACDDGNTTNGDGCDSNCTPTACGNGVVSAGEGCDDGNPTNGDNCDNNCTPTGCGNTIVTSGEACDDGNLVGGDGCEPDCSVTRCGDGTLTVDQLCDPNIGNACVNVCNTGWTPGFAGGLNGNGVMALFATGDAIYVGGDFGAFNGDTVPGNGVVRWRLGGWQALGDGTDSSVVSIAVGGTNVYVGGAFEHAGGVPAFSIAKWDGSKWSALGAGTGDAPQALLAAGTDLYAGGSFVTAGEITVNGIAKWNGSTWSALGSGVNGGVNALAQIGSDLYAAGQFDTAGGVSAANIAKWDGSSWSPLGSGCPGIVYSLAVKGSDLHAAGEAGVMKWDGANWTTIGTTDGVVAATVVHSGALYIAGSFSSVQTPLETVRANNIARWDGQRWWPLSSGTNDSVNALASDGVHVIVGGWFADAGGMAAATIAEWRRSECGEQCDDGNATNGDSCDSNCTPTACGNGIQSPGESCDDGNRASGDGCDANCTLTACGNGVRTGSEACDDANGADGDGCESDCTITPISATVGAGESVSTEAASPEFPVETAITTPTGGTITIASSPAAGRPTGFEVIGIPIEITAPPASASAPLEIVITLDASAIPPGFTPDRLVVMRDGAPIEDCTGPAGQAVPEPCIEGRTQLENGNVEIALLSAHASLWSVGVRGLFKREQKCITGVGKAALGVAKAQGKANLTCLKDAVAGSMDVDACVVADAKGKVRGSMDKTSKASASCSPLPPFAHTTMAITNTAAQDAARALLGEVLGADVNAAVAAADAAGLACQRGLVKVAQDAMAKEAKTYLGCEKAGLAGKRGVFVTAAQLATCVDLAATDSGGKIAKAIDKNCHGLNQAETLPGSCANAVDLALCVENRVRCRVCKLFNSVNDLGIGCDRIDDGAANNTCP